MPIQNDSLDKIALFDMDGTLADFAGGLQAVMQPMQSPGEQCDYDSYDQDNEPDFMKARRRAAKNQPGFWRDLPPHQPGFDLLAAAVQIGYRITIFTKAPMSQPAALSEKLQWCHQHLNPVLGSCGYQMAMVSEKGYTYGRILVDDFPGYIRPWLKNRPRGQVIMPAHGYNNDAFGSQDRVLRYTGKEDLPAAMAVMRDAFQR